MLLLEAGLTSGSASWALVHDQLASATRVCAYDRPGMDWSEDGDVDRRAGAVAERLHTLISAAELHEPMVLLGMSAGGVYVREYFARYPTGIAGMVLVDSSHEQQAKRLPGGDTSVAMTTMLTLCRGLQPFGVVRLTHGMDGLLDAISVPPDVRERLRATYYQTGRCAAIQEETTAFMADLAQAPAPRSLGDLPLLVISQGKPRPTPWREFRSDSPAPSATSGTCCRRNWPACRQTADASSRTEVGTSCNSNSPIWSSEKSPRS
ncbi:MAG: alpha/beta hydrolase [Pseudomonadales bacterium]